MSIRQACAFYDISKATLQNWLKHRIIRLNRNKPPSKIHNEALLKDVEQYPDDYMYERAHGFEGSKSGIEAALKRLGISQKKTLYHPKPCFLKRAKYQSKLGDYIVQGFAIVYMNESGFEAETLCPFGYATIDKHCIDSYDWQGKKRTDVIGAFEPAQDCWRLNILREYFNENTKLHS